MSTVKSPARPTGSIGRRDWTQAIQSKGSGLPSRMVLHAVEKIGKTSFAAHAPKPIFAVAKGETGLTTLIDSGRLPEVPHAPELQAWSELLDLVDWLTTAPHEYKTLVIDTLNGVERMCHEHVCHRDFKGDWTDKGFMGYMRGFEVSLADWRGLLVMLDKLREQKRMAIIGLCHTRVKNFRNPEGPDFDRYQPDMHEKTWGLTHKWADMILFANFETFAGKDRKAQGGSRRVMYTQRTAAFDAGNRHGLPEEISMGHSGQEAWANFQSALKSSRETTNTKE